MKRSTKLALSLVLAAGVVAPAMAQDNFPDVPANHWAYEALARMKADGLLVGYPDGIFRGPRPASRYELAVAMHAVYTHLKTLIDGMSGQLAGMTSVNPQDIQNLKDQIAHLQDEINAMKGWGDDIAALKKATEQFDKELRALGVDVEAMKKDIGDLAARVTALENRKPSVNISGDVNFLMTAGNSRDGRPGLNMDGRLEGNDGGAPVGLTRDVSMFHEAAFTFSGTNETGPTWKGTVVVGNLLGQGALGSQSTLSAGVPLSNGYAEGNEDVYIQDLSVDFKASVASLAFNAEVGRVGYKVSPYMFQRIEPSTYFSNERWDGGQYYFDGAILGFNFGGAKVHIWGGKNSSPMSTDGISLDPTIIANNRFAGGTTFAGSLVEGGTVVAAIDRTLAADASIPIGKYGHVNLAYLWLENNVNDLFDTAGAGNGNRDEVYGGDAELGFGRFKVEGGYHKSDLKDNNTSILNTDNSAWNAKVKFAADRFNVWGGYRTVDNNYYAPGDWGRLGILRNPANIKGWQVGGTLDITKALRLTASGEFDKGNEDEANISSLSASPFGTGTKIDNYMVRLDFRINPNFSIYGSYEDDRFSDLAIVTPGTGDSIYRWTTFGVGYGLSANAKLSVQYQLSDVSNDFVLGARPNGPADGRYTGGFLTTQLTVKF